MKFATRLSHSNQLQKYIKFQLILMSFENLVSLKDLKDEIEFRLVILFT